MTHRFDEIAPAREYKRPHSASLTEQSGATIRQIGNGSFTSGVLRLLDHWRETREENDTDGPGDS